MIYEWKADSLSSIDLARPFHIFYAENDPPPNVTPENKQRIFDKKSVSTSFDTGKQVKGSFSIHLKKLHFPT